MFVSLNSRSITIMESIIVSDSVAHERGVSIVLKIII